MKGLAIAAWLIVSLTLSLAPALPVSAQHAWTVTSTSPGVSVGIKSENALVTGVPWDTDGIDACPPIGAADTRCDWRTHVGADSVHMNNGVLAFTLDGAAALQSGVVTSDVWWDPVSSPTFWTVNYDVHFLAENPADIQTLRATSRFKHAGITQLTLLLGGLPTTTHLRVRVAPTHSWLETPEVGFEWTLEITGDRAAAGGRAMIWVDNIRVNEGPTVFFNETFSTFTDVGTLAAVESGPGLHVTPNPTNAATEIRFELAREERVAVEIFDVSGSRLRVLRAGTFAAGPHQLVWDGRDASGRRAVPGVYFVRLETGRDVFTAKTMLIE